jgi:hypothetical protein
MDSLGYLSNDIVGIDSTLASKDNILEKWYVWVITEYWTYPNYNNIKEIILIQNNLTILCRWWMLAVFLDLVCHNVPHVQHIIIPRVSKVTGTYCMSLQIISWEDSAFSACCASSNIIFRWCLQWVQELLETVCSTGLAMGLFEIGPGPLALDLGLTMFG